MATQYEERIRQAQSNPLYKTIYSIIDDMDNIDSMDDIHSAINNKFKDIADPSQLHSFLDEYKDTFFSENGARVPFMTDTNDIKFGIGGGTTSSSTAKETTSNVAEEVAEKTTKSTVKEAAEEGIESLGESNISKIFNKRTFNMGLNAFFAISDYKNAREEGKGVISSAAKAGGLFVAGEVLGGGLTLPAISLAKAAPKIAVSGLESMQRMTRQMNSIQRIQTFGEAQFQDTQQLATMRQAGMELAKMSQYNLQQSIMGNEAQYMHRI